MIAIRSTAERGGHASVSQIGHVVPVAVKWSRRWLRTILQQARRFGRRLLPVATCRSAQALRKSDDLLGRCRLARSATSAVNSAGSHRLGHVHLKPRQQRSSPIFPRANAVRAAAGIRFAGVSIWRTLTNRRISIFPGHRDVADQHVRAGFANGLDCLGGTGHGRDIRLIPPQHASDQFPRIGFVVDHQHPDALKQVAAIRRG